MRPAIEGCDRTGGSTFWLIISFFAAGLLPIAGAYLLTGQKSSCRAYCRTKTPISSMNRTPR